MYIFMFEKDQTVGNSDATVVREYVIGKFDTMSQAHQELRGLEAKLAGSVGHLCTITTNAGVRVERRTVLVERGRAHGYGNIIRTTWYSIQF